MCQNGNVVVQENQGQTKSFRDVVTWFGLPDYPNGNPKIASGPGVNSAKFWWSSYAGKNADPQNNVYGMSYVDLMLESILDIHRQFDDPTFVMHSFAYCRTVLQHRAQSMSKAALGGGVHEPLPLIDEDEDEDADTDEKRIEKRKLPPIDDIALGFVDDDMIHLLRQSIANHAPDQRTHQAALIFINIVLDIDPVDLEDVPIQSQGADQIRYLMKCAIYLATPVHQQTYLVSGASATVSRRFRTEVQKLQALLLNAWAAVNNEDDHE